MTRRSGCGLLAFLARREIPPAQLLAVFFFVSETASYMLCALTAALFVKHAGAASLPAVYVVLNVAFIPILLASALARSRSSVGAVSRAGAWYLPVLLLLVPAAHSTHVGLLGALYVGVRLGRLTWSTYAVGMVAEVLPLREARRLTPALLACQVGGIVAGGLALRPVVSGLGVPGTIAALWLLLVLSWALVQALKLLHVVAVEDGAAVPGAHDAASRPGDLLPGLRELLSQPLIRVLLGSQIAVTAIRYLLEFVYSDALATAFTDAQEMAGFAGTVDAVQSLTTIAAQLALTAPALRWLRLGGTALVGPGVMLSCAILGCLAPGLATAVLCQFAYWVSTDTFQKPVRQLLVGALPGRIASRAPLLIASAGMLGSLGASLLIIPLTTLGGAPAVLVLVVVTAGVLLVSSVPTGSRYTRTLEDTVEGRGVEEQARLLRSVRAGEERGWHTMLAPLLGAPDPEVRLRALQQVATAAPLEATAILSERIGCEPDARVRATLASCLGGIEPAALAEHAAVLLADPDARVRANAIEWLGTPGAPSHPDAPNSPRQEAAAIIARMRASADEVTLRPALLALAGMVRDPDRPARRAAAAGAMGKLSCPFFAEDLEALLADPEPAVRAAAAGGLVRLQVPHAGPALERAIARELDPDVRERLRDALRRMTHASVRAVLSAVDALGPAERRLVGRVLAAGPVDRRTALLALALNVEDARLRVELIRLLAALRTDGLLEVLGACLQQAAGAIAPRLDLSPLLFYLSRRERAREPEGYQALERLLLDTNRSQLVRHVTGAARDVWTWIALGEAQDLAIGPQARDRLLSLRERLLDHILVVTGLATHAPERVTRAMQRALLADKPVASLCLELLEEWLPQELKSAVLPILESYPDPDIRRRRAFELSATALNGALALVPEEA